MSTKIVNCDYTDSHSLLAILKRYICICYRQLGNTHTASSVATSYFTLHSTVTLRISLKGDPISG